MKKEKIKSISIIILLFIIIALIIILVINSNKEHVPNIENYSYIVSTETDDIATKKRVAIYDETDTFLTQVLIFEFYDKEKYLERKDIFNDGDLRHRVYFDDERLILTLVGKGPYDKKFTKEEDIKSLKISEKNGTIIYNVY